jgi:hypothetical protein
MRHSGRLASGVAAAWFLALSGCGEATKAEDGPHAPMSLSDPRLREVRLAMPSWATAPEPRRQVLDVVVLVPDASRFLEAIALWDANTWFPVLIDEPDFTAKFLHAFRPKRVVRYAKDGALPTSRPVDEGALWAQARKAVHASWRKPGGDPPPEDRHPRSLGLPGEPGVVLSSPRSPHLAAAVALSAGRFEPLLKWDVNEPFDAVLTLERAESLAGELDRMVGRAVVAHDRLGDPCDFLTIANDMPFRYRQPDGPSAGTNGLDDLLGRDLASGRRWAFAGRLFGSPAMAVYQAMGSLFLTPGSAALINAYGDPDPPWVDFSHEGAERTLRGWMTDLRAIAAPRSSLDGWLSFFDPINRAGLVFINSSGDPAGFNLPGGARGQTADVPSSDPAVVFMIHSYSAANLANPGTIARRWLDQGAYAYLGAMEEPYLQAFRTPSLEAELIAENVPLGAVARPTTDEPFGQPWRLLLVGDPLHRIRPRSEATTRAAFGPPPEGWAEVDDIEPRPDEGQGPAISSEWAGSLAIHRAGRDRDWPRVVETWQALVRSDLSDAAVSAWTERVSALATTMNQVPSWREAITRMAVERPDRKSIQAERDRLAGAAGG